MALTGQQQQGNHDDDEIRSNILRKDSSSQNYLLSAIKEYGKALQVGEKHLYQVVPRLLSIWFDFNAIEIAHEDPSADKIDEDSGRTRMFQITCFSSFINMNVNYINFLFEFRS